MGRRTGGATLNELRTDRLVLRRWRAEDRPAFAMLNADTQTMAYMPAPLSRRQSDSLIDYYESTFEDHGFGTWAVTTHDGDFVGAVGLLAVPADWDFGPTVEAGWRLRREQWGRGYATEAGQAALQCGFGEYGLTEIVALTAVVNTSSRAVMERLGMHRDPADDFMNPRVERGHRLEPHVLYRRRAEEVAA